MLLLRGRSAAPASSPCAVHRVLRAALPHSGAGATPEPASAPQHHSPAVFSPAYVEARLRRFLAAAKSAHRDNADALHALAPAALRRSAFLGFAALVSTACLHSLLSVDLAGGVHAADNPLLVPGAGVRLCAASLLALAALASAALAAYSVASVAATRAALRRSAVDLDRLERATAAAAAGRRARPLRRAAAALRQCAPALADGMRALQRRGGGTSTSPQPAAGTPSSSSTLAAYCALQRATAGGFDPAAAGLTAAQAMAAARAFAAADACSGDGVLCAAELRLLVALLFDAAGGGGGDEGGARGAALAALDGAAAAEAARAGGGPAAARLLTLPEFAGWWAEVQRGEGGAREGAGWVGRLGGDGGAPSAATPLPSPAGGRGGGGAGA